MGEIRKVGGVGIVGISVGLRKDIVSVILGGEEIRQVRHWMRKIVFLLGMFLKLNDIFVLYSTSVSVGHEMAEY